jgi:nitroreductase
MAVPFGARIATALGRRFTLTAMETWDALRSRRNTREYQDRPIAGPDLDRILEAGRRSPSSMNEQPWDFIVVTERATLERMADLWRWGAHIRGAAAAIALLSPASAEPEARETFAFDLGQASMSMMLAAADLGIGSCHSSAGDQAEARKVLGFPEDRETVILLSLGYPLRPLTLIENPKRRPASEVIHREHW